MSNFVSQVEEAYERVQTASLNAAKSAANTREAVAKVMAAAETAQIASTNATENLKLKTTQVLTESRIRMLDAMAEITTQTAIKAKDIAKQADSILELAEKNAAATKRHARSTLGRRKQVQDASKAHAQAASDRHTAKASRALKEAIANATEAQETLAKTLEWEKRALELVGAMRDLNTAQQDAVQKATIVVDVPAQPPATDLESVQVVTDDIAMNNSVISDNVDATKKAGDVAISTNDVVKAEEAATDATSSAIQATTNAQTALKNAEAAKKLLDDAAATSVATGDHESLELEKATVVAEEAAKLAAEAKDKAVMATDAAKDAEKVVLKVSAGTVAANYNVAYFVGGAAVILLVVGAMRYYYTKRNRAKLNRSYYM